MTLRVRALSEEEGHRLARMTRSQKLGAGLVRRAQIIQHAVDGLSAPGIAAKMGLCGATVRFWLKRFNERGLPGLEEEMRSGRPPTYTAEQRSEVVAAALSRPAESGPAVRVVDAGPPGGLFGREGHRHEAQPHERDPAGRRAEVAAAGDLVRGAGGPGVRRKRGRSSASTPPRPRAASSSASTRWGPKPPRASRPARGRAGPSQGAAGQAGVDYGRRGKGYVFGAFLPATGDALTAPYPGRTTANWVDFLGKLEAWIDPSVARVYAVMDNLIRTARPMCCSSRSPIRAGSSSSSRSTRPT